MLPSYKLSTVWNKEDKYTPLLIPRVIGARVCWRIWKGNLTKTRFGYKNKLGSTSVPWLLPVIYYTNYLNSTTFGFLLVEAGGNANENNSKVAKICITFWSFDSSRNSSFMITVEVVINKTLFNFMKYKLEFQCAMWGNWGINWQNPQVDILWFCSSSVYQHRRTRKLMAGYQGDSHQLQRWRHMREPVCLSLDSWSESLK